MLSSGAVQTTYGRYINIGQVGMPASMNGWDISTRIAEDVSGTNAGLGFGLVVSQGTKHGDRSAVLGTLSGRAYLGISAADKTLPAFQAQAGVDKYNDTDNMAVMIRGDIWVTAVGTVAPGGAVYFNSTTGQLGPSGIANATLLVGAQWLTTAPLAAGNIMKTPTGQLAVVRLVATGNF